MLIIIITQKGGLHNNNNFRFLISMGILGAIGIPIWIIIYNFL